MNQVINIPDGFELKKVSETEYKIVPKERKLPKTWEEFCEIDSRICNNEYYINARSDIVKVPIADRTADLDKNICQSKEIAEGILALMQLIQLRDYYNNGWKRDNNSFKDRGEIIYMGGNLSEWTVVTTKSLIGHIFTFKSADLAKEFLNNFKDLLDKVKYLF